ncbi:MAG: DUF7024 domain-containing protein [Telluria sp.]
MTSRWPARLDQPLRNFAFPSALLAAFIYLAWRNMGLYPMVFADEWLYSSAARLLPFDKSILPSYLYLALFSATNSCGPGFLECARILNAALLVAAAPLIYLIARKMCSRPVAAVLALAGVLAPASSFTAYFMPEMMYFLSFFMFAWAALSWTAKPPLAYGLATGALLGVMSAIKVHALFLLPAHLAFIAWLCFAQYRGRGPLRAALTMMAAAAVSMIAVRLAIGYAVAGPAGLNLLGNFYGAHATNSASTLESLLRVLPAAMVSLKGHALALALLMPLPLATLLLHAIDPGTRAAASGPQRALQVFAVLMLGAAGAMTVMFTASIATAGPLEGVRLHQRYYDFVFPLLLIIAAAPLAAASPQGAPGSTVRRALAALPMAALVLYAARVLPAEYTLGFIDTPELSVLREFPAMLMLVQALALLTLAVWVLQPRFGILLFVFAALPLLALNLDRGVRDIQARSLAPGPYDKAGMLAADYLDTAQAGKLTVAGADPGGLHRALFHIDNPDAKMHELRTGAAFAREDLSPGQDWVLVVGKHALPEEIIPVIQTPDFALIKVRVAHTRLAKIDFNKTAATDVIAGYEGLAQPEPWGAWSLGPSVRLRFAKPLPKELNILIKANAFPPNADQEFVMVVGGQRKPFRLSGSPQDRLFQFETSGKEYEVKVEIPRPLSPRSLGYGNDDRALGIGFTSMEIGTR